ncbi:uncharacterized protein LOC108089301 [Drosophila ficusphila]|uniref:uncharacterized protein LOC108089301 n=1 Tax=Drosophila ficusphila TaxID=30025 RepID=UPI001C88FF9B|nr:uncharacterized protein LOC108089301 [Drosophila ficusphila]
MFAFIFIFLLLINVKCSQSMYIVIPTNLGRSFELREETLYQETIPAIEIMEDPAKLYTPNDFFGDAQKLIVAVQKFLQHPPTSLHSAFNQLQSNAKKNHQKQKPVKNKVVLDPFGNISFTLGWSANLQVFNSIAFTKNRSLVNYNGRTKG